MIRTSSLLVRTVSLLLLLALSLCACSSKTPVVGDGTSNGTSDITSDDTSETETDETTAEADPLAGWDDDGELKILTFGNSFSDDAMQYVYQIAKDLGITKITLGNLYIGACTLNIHARNAQLDAAAYDYRTNTKGTWSNTPGYKMKDALASQDWDFVSLQQSSGSSGIQNTYAQLPKLIQYIEKHAPDAKIVWHMTWAYDADVVHHEFVKYDKDQMTMYRAILEAVEKKVVTQKKIVAVIPAGTAIQNARTSYAADRLTRDGYHLSYDLGRYIAGLTLVHTLTVLPLTDLTYAPKGVDDTLRQMAIEAVTNAVLTPTEVTPSTFTAAA